MDKCEFAKNLAFRRSEIEPDMVEVWRVIGDNEDNPDEPVKLLKVNEETFISKKVNPFVSGRRDRPFRTSVAEVSPQQLQSIKDGQTPLPKGWTLNLERVFSR